nr:hypothetical protein [Chlamydiota bacterium]
MAVPPVGSGTPNTQFEPVSGHRSPSIPSTLVSLQASKEKGSCLSELFRPFVKFFNWILSLFCPAEEPDDPGKSKMEGKPKIEGLPEEIDIQGNLMLTNGHLFKYLVALSGPEDSTLYFPQDSNHLLATRETLVGYMDRKEVSEALSNDKICFFPMREGPHLTCVIINSTKQTIGYYDSKGTGRAAPGFLQGINAHLS